MADRTQLKVAGANDMDRDDPFAELTKIMGFDPRVPMKRSEAEALRSLGTPAPVVDDFEIDLEKELLGEFAFDDEPLTLVAANEAEAPPLTAASQPNHAAWENEIPSIPEAATHVDAPEAEFGAAGFDAAVRDWSDATVAQPVEEIRADEGIAVSNETAIEELEALPVVDEAVFDEFENEFAGEWQDEAVSDAYAPAQTEDKIAAAPEADLDASFDAAMAEVDMDFTAVAKLYGARDRVPEQSYAPVAEAVVVEDAGDDGSLEDELNVLLGNRLRQVEPAPSSPVAEAQEDNLDDLDWHTDLAATEETSELQAAVAYDYDAAEAGYEAAAYAEESGSSVAYVDDEPVSAAWEEPNAAYSKPAQSSDEAVEFDEAAFAATFAEGMDDSLPEEDASRYEADEPVYEQPEAPAALYEPQARVEEPDPFEALTRMAASYRSPDAEPVVYQEEPVAYADEPEEPAYDHPTRVAARADVPEIETVDVPETAIALADDLDLPELTFEDETPPSAYDDLDAEFASLLNDMNNVEQAAPPQPAAAQRDTWYERPHRPAAYAYPAAAAPAVSAYDAQHQPVAQADDIDVGELDLNFDDQAFEAAMAGHEYDDETDALPPLADYDPDLDQELDIAGVPPMAENPRSRRGFWVAALVGGVAVLGGIGAFALSFGESSGSGTPALVKADTSPIKIRPQNPGGTVVANQDNKVYESVARTATPNDAPKQEKLVTTVEEPVDMPVEQPEPDASVVDVAPEAVAPDTAMPAPKGEDRIEQVIENAAEAPAEVATVTPRKVRTMVVKPDGSLVPADMPTPAPATEVNNVGADAAPLSPPPVDPSQELPPVAEASQPAAADAPAEVAAVQTTSTPATAPIAPARPADQPVDVVGEVKPDQVAAIDTTATATAATSGAWSMQIASQPSEAAAQSTYQDLARRYGSVLEGRSVNIVKADISGKGTFWRVRVPAQSRNDAVNLCNSYKAAGGNCFVSR